jgi:hypothetical protein
MTHVALARHEAQKEDNLAEALEDIGWMEIASASHIRPL